MVNRINRLPEIIGQKPGALFIKSSEILFPAENY